MKKIKLKHVADCAIFIATLSTFTFSDITIIQLPTRFFLIGILLLVLLFDKQIYFSSIHLWYTGFLTINIISLLLSQQPNVALYENIKILQLVIIMLLIYNYIYKYKNINILINSVILSCFILVLRLIMLTPVNHWGSTRLGYAIDTNSNLLAMKLTLGVILILFYILKKKSYISIILIITFVATILLSGSKRSLIILIVVFPIMFLFSKSGKHLIKGFIYASVLTSILIYLIFNVGYFYNVIGQRLMEFLLSIFTGDDNSISTNDRINMIRIGFRLFTENPVFGWGTGTYSVVSGLDRYSHNNYIEVLVGTGFFGFAIYYSFLVYILMRSVVSKTLSGINKALVVAIIMAVLISDIAAPSYSSYYIHYSILIAVLTYNKGKEIDDEI